VTGGEEKIGKKGTKKPRSKTAGEEDGVKVKGKRSWTAKIGTWKSRGGGGSEKRRSAHKEVPPLQRQKKASTRGGKQGGIVSVKDRSKGEREQQTRGEKER